MVETLRASVKALLSRISDYLEETISGAELEQYTMEIIAHDDFDDLSEEIQDIIYTLDNRELNKLSKEDIIKLQADLRSLLS